MFLLRKSSSIVLIFLGANMVLKITGFYGDRQLDINFFLCLILGCRYDQFWTRSQILLREMDRIGILTLHFRG
jgi:hypothetical protein